MKVGIDRALLWDRQEGEVPSKDQGPNQEPDELPKLKKYHHMKKNEEEAEGKDEESSPEAIEGVSKDQSRVPSANNQKLGSKNQYLVVHTKGPEQH